MKRILAERFIQKLNLSFFCRIVTPMFLGDARQKAALLDMLEDRNRSSHIYDEATAEEIFERIVKVYIPVLEKVLKKNRS